MRGAARDRAALIALLRLGRRSPSAYAEAVERAGSASVVLQQELAGGDGQGILLPERPEPLLTDAEAEIAAWERDGFELLTVLDERYPQNLRTVHDRPPVLFMSGRLTPQDARSVAVIGSRRASLSGLAAATRIADRAERNGDRARLVGRPRQLVDQPERNVPARELTSEHKPDRTGTDDQD